MHISSPITKASFSSCGFPQKPVFSQKEIFVVFFPDYLLSISSGPRLLLIGSMSNRLPAHILFVYFEFAMFSGKITSLANLFNIAHAKSPRRM